MMIHVEFMAFIKRPEGLSRKFDKEIEENLVLRNFMLNIGFSDQEMKLMQFFVSRPESTKTTRVRKRYQLQNRDILFVTIPIGGG